jgi:hypothetical protein
MSFTNHSFAIKWVNQKSLSYLKSGNIKASAFREKVFGGPSLFQVDIAW